MKHFTLPLRDLFPDLEWADTKFYIAQHSDTGLQPLNEFTHDLNHWRDYWTKLSPARTIGKGCADSWQIRAERQLIKADRTKP